LLILNTDQNRIVVATAIVICIVKRGGIELFVVIKESRFICIDMPDRSPGHIFGKMTAKQLKALEKENARLKKMVAEQVLDREILKVPDEKQAMCSGMRW